MKIIRALNWKYALGELGIVIVGILVAIQVDAWNQDRMDRRLAASYLDRLAVDLTEDREFFEASMQDELRAVAAADSMLLWISRSTPPRQGDIHRALGWMPNSAPVQVRLATWTDLLTTGRVDLIEPADLRDRLLRYYHDTQGPFARTVDGVEEAQLEQYWDYYARLGPQSGGMPPVLQKRFGAEGAFYAPWSAVVRDREFFQFLDRTRAWSLSVAATYWYLTCEAEEVLADLSEAGATAPTRKTDPAEVETSPDDAKGLFDVTRVAVECSAGVPPIPEWVLWPEDEDASN